MEITTGNIRTRIMMIDATELDDDQLNDLIGSINPRRSTLPVSGIVILLCIAITLIG